jgi:hypothetical protein
LKGNVENVYDQVREVSPDFKNIFFNTENWSASIT